MVKGSATPSDGSPVTAGVPLVGPDSADQRNTDTSMEVGQTVQFDEDGKDQGIESGEASRRDYEEKAEDAELGDVETTAELLSEVVELTLQVGRMGPHVDKSAGDENDEEEHGVAHGSAYGCSAKFKLGEDPSKIPLPKTPETKKREVFCATEGTPYFEDSYMQTPMEARSVKRTPSRNASKSSRYSYMYDEAELGGGNGEDEEPCYRGDPNDSVKNYIRHLSFDNTEEDTTSTSKSAQSDS
ncbi:hypothetical protein PI125_g19319 [Phytophthora idaei]|nr:hypothetical protein PI125_g19319 [Phytophthora idaei]KAG3136230.1 hypothetical protein PI126_g17905 [Phytophthora idaei]